MTYLTRPPGLTRGENGEQTGTMPERGAELQMPRVAGLVLRGLEYFTWPLQLDDYLELISPLWSTKELRGRIERVQRETADAVTVFITPGFRWRGHLPGQYLRIGFDIEGKRHWRAYSLTSHAARPDGQIAITVKRKEDGVVSRFLHSRQAAGSIVTLGEVEGEFTLTDPPAKQAPVPHGGEWHHAGDGDPAGARASRGGPRRGARAFRPGRRETIFAQDLTALATRRDCYRLVLRATAEHGRMHPDQLDSLCPDWRERETYACGPGAMLQALRTHFEEAQLPERLHVESFEHFVIDSGEWPRRHDRVLAGPTGRSTATAARRSWSPGSRPASTCRPAAGWASATPASGGWRRVRFATCAPAS